MENRKRTPDILGDLLGNAGTPEIRSTSLPAKQKAIKPVKQKAGRKAETTKKKAPEASGTIKKPSGVKIESKETSSIKATFYISEAAVEALEQAWHTLRKAAPTSERARISKSAIVQEAILEFAEKLKRQKSGLNLVGRRG